MDYLCAKFGDFSFSRFGFIVRTRRQTESQADQRYTHATTVRVCTVYVSNHTLQPSFYVAISVSLLWNVVLCDAGN